MLKISLFNKGIYKSQITRFKWGSLLYFILLFFTSSFVLLIEDFSKISEHTLERYMKSGGVILNDDFFMFSVLLATVVPTVVTFLTFDMFSSKRQSVFIHSLPCGRNSIYISTILGAFTLMAVPVVLNGCILMLISLFKYSELFSLYACFKWMAANLILLFIMFSISVFSTSLTASRVSLVLINAFLHIAPVMVAFSIGGVSSAYLYGFDENFNELMNKTVEWMPATAFWIRYVNRDSILIENIFSFKSVIFSIGAIVLYITGLILYKKRNNESAGNFVAFKIMNPIFKYVICAFGVVVAFSVMNLSGFERGFYMVLLLFVISFILYFASEMVLRKSLKVFDAYKGYIVFGLVCIALNVFMQYTGFFGYEKRVPAKEDVVEVAIYSGYNQEKPFTDNEGVIEEAIKRHENIVESVPVLISRDQSNMSRITVEYKLKNGKILKRAYRDISTEKHTEIMRGLYTHEAYRFATNDVIKLDTNYIDYIRLSFEASGNCSYSFGIEGKKNIEEFLAEWKKDIALLGYDELQEYTPIYLSVDYDREIESYLESSYVYVHQGFNHNYKNVMSYLNNKGYFDDLFKLENYNVYISKKTHIVENKIENEIERQYFDGKESDYYLLEADDVEKIMSDDVETLVKGVIDGRFQNKYSEGEIYLIYAIDSNNKVFERFSLFLSIEKENLPDYLKKYVN